LKINPIKTVLTISVGFLFIYLLGKYNWALWISFLVGLIGVFSEKLSVIIEKVWMKLAFVLSKIVPNIVLAFIFFLLLWPIAFLTKIIRKKEFFKLKHSNDSFYTLKNGGYSKSFFDNMW
jgi:hypothetical protein